FSSRGRRTRFSRDWSSDVCSADLDSTLSVTPSQQTRAVGDWADFVVEVKNTGFGALFDVVIDESLIHNNPSSNLQLDTGSVSRTSSNPLPHATGGNGDIFTIPYLGPGESFTL